MQSKCPHCQTVLDVSPFAPGSVIACANCQQNLTVPAPVAHVAVPTAGTQRSTNRRQRRAKARVEQRQIYFKLFAFVTVIAVVLGLFVMGNKPLTPLTPAEQAKQRVDAQKREAMYWAKEFVKIRCRAPSTADFGRQTSSSCVSRGENGMYTVNGYVDAQNGFGLTVRNRFRVVLKTTENGLIPISVEIY